jgi:hypothetical protein
MRYLALLLIGVVGCGGAKAAETSASPTRGLRSLRTDDPDLTAIATVAAQTLPSAGTALAKPVFRGVFVNGQMSRSATDAVMRATGFTQASSTRQPFVVCRVSSSSGQSTPTQCPGSVKASLPSTFSFDEVRATADSAYVGVTEVTGAASKASCLTLVRRGNDWQNLGSAVIAVARRCGG